MHSVVQNPRFDFSEFSKNARQCIIFSTTIYIFHITHVMLIPQAPLFYRCFGTQICVFHEFHAPRASETPTLCFPNVLGLKSLMDCQFQPKTHDFFKNNTFLYNMCQISRSMCSVVQNLHFDFSEFAENARQCIIFSITICTFHTAHVMLIPQAPLFYMCFGTQICVFSRISRSARI